MCSKKDIGELFIGKPDSLVLAYDDIIQHISTWKPFSAGASVHSIIVTSKKAWLIIKPMKKELDVKFYTDRLIESERIHKVTEYRNKFAIHLRVHDSFQLDQEFFRLLKEGFNYSLENEK
jgi:hypothetical protein